MVMTVFLHACATTKLSLTCNCLGECPMHGSISAAAAAAGNSQKVTYFEMSKASV